MNSRGRNFCFELYPEDGKHMEILDNVIDNYDYCFILHDKDIWEEDVKEKKEIIHKKGDLKKPHYHVIISFKNPRSTENVKRELGLKHVETCNFYAYVRYLVHKDNKNKYHYNDSDIETNILTRVQNALGKEYNAQEQDCRILYNYIKDKNFITFRQLTDYAIENGCLMELKRNTYFYKQFCDDYGFNRHTF